MKLVVEPNKVLPWDVFKLQPNSIALDGYVLGKPQHDPVNRTFNFNHHEDVDRLATRCTAAQVYIYLKQGLNNLLDQHTTLYVNDCDQDVCLSTWLLLNYSRVTGSSEPLLNRLIFGVDMLDTCAGNYPLQVTSALFEQMLWIFQPYNEARLNGIHLLNATQISRIIEDVHNRIDKYLVGQSIRLTANTSYEVMVPGKIPVIKELGLEARTKLLAHYDCYISYKGPTQTGGHVYSIIKLSPLSNIQLDAIYTALNTLEKFTDPRDSWGGSNTCGGSPRFQGSFLTPQAIVNFLSTIYS